jgi:wobble nucleotide-excising tRNase
VSGAEDIPDEYLVITDPDAHLESLQNNLKFKQELRESALTEKTSTASRLDAYKEAHPEACQETVDKAKRNFEEVQSLLNHWLHIQEVFKEQKENIHDNPMQDIADRFAHYLGVISGGRVSSEFPEADKLNMNIYSENNLLDYGKLSEGTKETVSLAFRLAVLDHLFPEGGGVIVFDDPFTDMDADRTAQSCELIKECATRHQVIFLTCREDYLSALEGNRILF